jgi:hypothetical protein
MSRQRLSTRVFALSDESARRLGIAEFVPNAHIHRPEGAVPGLGRFRAKQAVSFRNESGSDVSKEIAQIAWA